MNFDKESKFRDFFFFVGGGGGGGGGGARGDMNTKPPYFIRKTHCHISSTEPYSLMKIFLTVFKTECIVALTIKGR